MTLLERIVEVEFRLGEGSFGADGSNSVKLSGVRCSAAITKVGGVSMSTLDLRVWGLPAEVMAKLTVLNQIMYTSARLNTVIVSAGDTTNGIGVCFVGIISEAWADASGQPEVLFHLSAHTGKLDAMRPIAVTSFNGAVDVVTVIANIAAQMNPPRSVENSGVNITLRDPYFPGTALDQVLAVARHADINISFDDDATNPNGTSEGAVIAIWPKGKSRFGQRAVISAETGMVGYPEFTQNGVRITTLYNPSLTFGQTVEVQSLLQPAQGRWTVASVSHNLDSNMPGGAWFTQIECSLLGREVAIVG